MRPQLLFYCRHSLGLGHLARSLRLAAELAKQFDVLLVNGGRFPDGTGLPTGAEVVNLPPLGHDADYRLVSHDHELSVEEACERRRNMLLDILDETAPAVVIVEMYPFGRKKFEFETPVSSALRLVHRRRRCSPGCWCPRAVGWWANRSYGSRRGSRPGLCHDRTTHDRHCRPVPAGLRLDVAAAAGRSLTTPRCHPAGG